MRGCRLRLAIIFAGLSFFLLASSEAFAFRPQDRGVAASPLTILSMGDRPTLEIEAPQPVSTAKTPKTLKKVAIDYIQQPLAVGNPDQAAVQAAAQVLQGASVGSDKRLVASSVDTIAQRYGAVLKRATVDSAGNRHVRVAQLYNGIQVVGAELIIHINAQNQIYRITGKQLPIIDISTDAGIDPQAALKIGLER